ncbi:MAG: hypothetical protein OHK0046_46010 [Anaerolineae bacterium]
MEFYPEHYGTVSENGSVVRDCRHSPLSGQRIETAGLRIVLPDVRLFYRITAGEQRRLQNKPALRQALESAIRAHDAATRQPPTSIPPQVTEPAEALLPAPVLEEETETSSGTDITDIPEAPPGRKRKG